MIISNVWNLRESHFSTALSQLKTRVDGCDVKKVSSCIYLLYGIMWEICIECIFTFNYYFGTYSLSIKSGRLNKQKDALEWTNLNEIHFRKNHNSFYSHGLLWIRFCEKDLHVSWTQSHKQSKKWEIFSPSTALYENLKIEKVSWPFFLLCLSNKALIKTHSLLDILNYDAKLHNDLFNPIWANFWILFMMFQTRVTHI